MALAGRSNVGKSSLVNALAGRNALARTSHTPGRTQEVNLLHRPGAADARRHAGLWLCGGEQFEGEGLDRADPAYLRGRHNLARVFLLINSRHGLKPTDDAVLKTLDQAAVSYQVVLTKADAVKPPELEHRIAETLEKLKRRPAAFPKILATSSRTGAGMAELRATIAGLLAERAGPAG